MLRWIVRAENLNRFTVIFANSIEEVKKQVGVYYEPKDGMITIEEYDGGYERPEVIDRPVRRRKR